MDFKIKFTYKIRMNDSDRYDASFSLYVQLNSTERQVLTRQFSGLSLLEKLNINLITDSSR